MVGNEPFAVVLPDVLVDEASCDLKRDNMAEMKRNFEQTGAAQVMAFPVPMAGMSDPAGHVPAVGEHQAEILDQAEKLE